MGGGRGKCGKVWEQIRTRKEIRQMGEGLFGQCVAGVYLPPGLGELKSVGAGQDKQSEQEQQGGNPLKSMWQVPTCCKRSLLPSYLAPASPSPRLSHPLTSPLSSHHLAAAAAPFEPLHRRPFPLASAPPPPHFAPPTSSSPRPSRPLAPPSPRPFPPLTSLHSSRRARSVGDMGTRTLLDNASTTCLRVHRWVTTYR